MWSWVFQIVLSILIIWTCHSLWNYFIHTFSKQKTRDLVSIHTEKYKAIIQELSEKIDQSNEFNKHDIEMDLEQFIREKNDNYVTETI